MNTPRTLALGLLLAASVNCGGRSELVFGSATAKVATDAGRDDGAPTIDASLPVSDACVDCVPTSEAGPFGFCPVSGKVMNGVACQTGMQCLGVVSCRDASPTMEECECVAGLWSCPPVHCAGFPPDPNECLAGNACPAPGETCRIKGGGACGGDQVFTCGDDGRYGQPRQPCDGVGGCATSSEGPDGGCSETCNCENGDLVCTGNCRN